MTSFQSLLRAVSKGLAMSVSEFDPEKASRNQIEADTGKQSLYHSESVTVDNKKSMPMVK